MSSQTEPSPNSRTPRPPNALRAVLVTISLIGLLLLAWTAVSAA
jgi:hypothetical protein